MMKWMCWMGLWVGLAGCVSEEQSTLSHAERAAQEQEANRREYDALTTKLETRREVVLDAHALNTVGPLHVRGETAFWLRSEGAWQSLHSMNMRTKARTAYTFPVTTRGEDNPYAVSESLLVTIELDGGDVLYHAYAVGEARREVGSFSLRAPTNAKWWAFGVDVDTVYVVEDTPPSGPDIPGETRLLSWNARDQQLREITTFEALGIRSGIVEKIDVYDGQLMFVESGRLWSIDLEAREAIWAPSAKRVGRVFYDRRGILYSDAAATLRYHDARTGETRDLTAEITEAGWRFNSSYTAISEYTGAGFTRLGDLVVYISVSQSVMAYDLNERTITPILLDPRRYGPEDDPLTFSYSEPRALSDGRLLVHGNTGFGKRVSQERWVYEVETRFTCTRSCP